MVLRKKTGFRVLFTVITVFVLLFAACVTTAQTSIKTETIIDDYDARVVPRFISNNFAQDSSGAFVVQWHNDINIPLQKLQIAKEEDEFENGREIAAISELFDISGIKTCPSSSIGQCGEVPCTGPGNYPARKIFRVTVDNLEPATGYKYRVGQEEAWSETFFHLTSGGKNRDFSFTVVTDPQNSNFFSMKTTLKAAGNYDSDNRFFLIGGDIVNYIGLNPSEIENYTRTANEFNIKTPIAATQGNHDTYHNKAGDQYVFGEATVFNAYVAFPDNSFSDPYNAPGRSKSYYFYYNDVLVIMLNTFATDNPTGKNMPNYASQAVWLKNILEKDKKEKLSKYRIVVTHIPPLAGRSSERWISPETRAAFGKICTDNNVDIFFAGHDHVYCRSNPIKLGASARLRDINFEPAQGGTIFSIAGGTGPKFYTIESSDTWIPKYYPVRKSEADIKPGIFINIKVTAKKLFVTVKRADAAGEVLDTYEVPVK